MELSTEDDHLGDHLEKNGVLLLFTAGGRGHWRGAEIGRWIVRSQRSVGVVGAAVWSVGLAHPVVGLGAESSATGLLWWAFVLELGGSRSCRLVWTGARQVGS